MLSPIVLALAAFYSFVGAVIIRRFRKPTCRVCLYREFCPNRESENSGHSTKPCWSCGQPAGCVVPQSQPEGSGLPENVGHFLNAAPITSSFSVARMDEPRASANQ